MRTPGKRPVTPETLMRIATFYLAQRAASSARLRDVLTRKIHRRLGPDEEPPDAAALAALVDPVIDKLTRAGLLDDEAYARGRAASLAAKGRPAWRIRTELEQAGVEAPAEALAEIDPLEQARIFARRKRLGPFRPEEGRESNRERDIAALARAGFSAQVARTVVDETQT